MMLLDTFLLAVAIFAALPAAILASEVLVAIVFSKAAPTNYSNAPAGKTVVLIPAHNEEAVIQETLERLQNDLPEAFEILVVADNCTDQTAKLVREAGVDVAERFDEDNRGKGFALDFGRSVLSEREEKPDAVIVFDADCYSDEASLSLLSDAALALKRPAQARYLCLSPGTSEGGGQINVLAMIIKNWVRAKGLFHLGMPCQLMGTGMAFAWEVFKTAPLASDNIVEDLELGLTLAMRRQGAVFVEAAKVTSTFPETQTAQSSQRTRWEHGHLSAILQILPRYGPKAVISGNVGALALLADLSVPPLSFYLLGLCLVGAVSTIAALFGAGWMPAVFTLAVIAAFICTIALAWARFARTIVPTLTAGNLLKFIVTKLPMYRRFFTRREQRWIRTDRD